MIQTLFKVFESYGFLSLFWQVCLQCRLYGWCDLNKMKNVWITWEFQRRNIGISSALGWPLVQIEIESPLIKRYFLSLWKTFKTVLKKRPDVMVVQNPSLVLAFFGVFWASFSGCCVIIDAHNSGIYPLEGRSALLMVMADWLQKKANLVIVTNGLLKKVVDSHGGRGFVLPDKIPDPPMKIETITLAGQINVVFICTYSDDEPYREVLKAATLIGEDVVIYFTGKYHGKVKPTDIPTNVRLLGFVSEEKYWTYLKSADIIMDLTLRENCLVCGAYEAVALCKPLILSDTCALRSYFNSGCLFVRPTVSSSIACGIQEAVRSVVQLQSDVVLLHNNLQASWSKRLDSFIHEIDNLKSNLK